MWWWITGGILLIVLVTGVAYPSFARACRDVLIVTGATVLAILLLPFVLLSGKDIRDDEDH